jgi:hypothetical protein
MSAANASGLSRRERKGAGCLRVRRCPRRRCWAEGLRSSPRHSEPGSCLGGLPSYLRPPELPTWDIVSITTIDGRSGLPWPSKLSIDARYQMANRFAWGWKIASLGVSGSLNATEMHGLFPMAHPWTDAVHHHGADRVPPEAWGRRIDVGGTPFVPLIQSRTVPLPGGWL